MPPLERRRELRLLCALHFSPQLERDFGSMGLGHDTYELISHALDIDVDSPGIAVVIDSLLVVGDAVSIYYLVVIAWSGEFLHGGRGEITQDASILFYDGHAQLPT